LKTETTRNVAFALEVAIVDAGDQTIKVVHTFYGETEREVRTYFREHQQSCEYFAAAVKDGRALQELEEIDDDELPEPEDFEEVER
jgi:pyrroloquinoline quinone (PQQ) biosynthesis protein C